MGAYLALNALPALNLTATWKPDVVQAHFAVPTGVLAWFLHRMKGMPYVISTQLGDIPGGLPDQTDHLFRLIMPFTKRVWKDAAAVTAPSEHIRELAGRTYRRPIEVIPNGLDTSSIVPSPVEIHDPIRLVFAGRFNPQKNLPLLIDLAARVKDLPWVMDLLGDGPQMQSIRSRIDQNGLMGRIRLHGWVSPQRVTEVLGQSDLMILPSWIEGMPLVGAAALGAGLAILGSAVGGIADVVVPGENGLLCSPGDINQFEQALRLLLTDKGRLRAMKQASRDLAGRYDLRNVAAEFEKIFLAVGRCRH
jgi:glycosyltransferase involved in cell wall biosynthesis